jgi:hypothetical protein
VGGVVGFFFLITRAQIRKAAKPATTAKPPTAIPARAPPDRDDFFFGDGRGIPGSELLELGGAVVVDDSVVDVSKLDDLVVPSRVV